MYPFLIILGVITIALLFLWQHMKMHHLKTIPTIKKKNSKQKTPEEYRRMAKKFLKEKRFIQAEEYYEKAKIIEEQMKGKK